ncbi:MAG TPA: hypothetical protein VFQ85_19445 [Mycobacteriales bacterium]|jgi:hypothetical protein|nr:hypothetical protein [Mycobacteriales bacterium]
MPITQRPRLLATALLSALALTAVPAHAAAPKPQITDPKGDTAAPMAGTDLVSVLFGTSGTTAKVKKKTVYTPTKLVVTLTYDGQPSADPTVSHVVTFDAPGCDDVYLQVYGGDGTFGSADCVNAAFDFGYKTSGNTITLTLPFGALGKSLRGGAKLGALRAYTAVGDPLIGLETVVMTSRDETANDVAKTDALYTVK